MLTAAYAALAAHLARSRTVCHPACHRGRQPCTNPAQRYAQCMLQAHNHCCCASGTPRHHSPCMPSSHLSRPWVPTLLVFSSWIAKTAGVAHPATSTAHQPPVEYLTACHAHGLHPLVCLEAAIPIAEVGTGTKPPCNCLLTSFPSSSSQVAVVMPGNLTSPSFH